jgi:maltose phosphorylase|tara:strand:+ start:360 stop:2639 length:2280 start_codon:yes stop_codon:yes gene_type:complete
VKNQYLDVHPWKIIEKGFNPNNVKSSESIFSIGNGAMGQRANFEEYYSGDTFQGSYIGGVYYPDKTLVGWWKNGYPDYFAKVLNAPSWIGIHLEINNVSLDLNSCKEVKGFYRELDMKTGIYTRFFKAQVTDDCRIEVMVKRFLSMDQGALGVIHYTVKSLQGTCEISIDSFIDGHITNQDSNWDDPFWEHQKKIVSSELIALHSKTLKTEFDVCTFAHTSLLSEDGVFFSDFNTKDESWRLSQCNSLSLAEGQECTILKFGGYINGMNHSTTQFTAEALAQINHAKEKGFDVLISEQKAFWSIVWEQSDIEIKGDDKAQQAIRFNIFQLNQTYNGKDARLNIGPKGFTGEKYGGSTYWDTEAYCLPFYMATKNQDVARNLLKYRYDQLDKAIENAKKLGFNKGAALYPMVTINGEECHNEWEITFEEIHRNGAIAFAIYNYERFTGDTSYIPEMGLEVLVAIARFWAQRVHYSDFKKAYVMLGVTGPNEYENNVNNNWYTNYLAQWCLTYAKEQVAKVALANPRRFEQLKNKINWRQEEADQWTNIASAMYFPKHPTQDLFLQQDGFLDKELFPTSSLAMEERPINQHWSWDRILRSPYIKQADVLQGFYFFEDQFDTTSLERHFNFYEPLTVHESSLSPCIHSILASRLDKMELAYSFYLQTSRLDLDDYNKEVEEGLHITSMAGTWMSIVEGFGGVRVKNNQLHINPKLPNQWEEYSFKINFRGTLIKVGRTKKGTQIQHNNSELLVYLDGKAIEI